MMRCPSCGAFVASTDSNCWKCDVPLAADGQADAPAPQAGEEEAPLQEPVAPAASMAPDEQAPPEPAPAPPPEAAPPVAEAPAPPEPAPPAVVTPPGKASPPGPAQVGAQGSPPPAPGGEVSGEGPGAPPEPGEAPEPEEAPADEDDFADMDGSTDRKGPAPPPRFEPKFGERAPEDEPVEGPSGEEAPGERRPPAPGPVRPRQRRTAAPPRPKGPDVYRPRRGFSEGRQEAIVPPTKWKNYNIGTFISLAAVIILFTTFLLPWYYIDMEAEDTSGNTGLDESWETDGKVRIVEVNGHDPILMDVSPFTNDTVGVTDDPMEGYFPIPMGILWGSILAISMFYRFTRNKPWRRGKKFIKTGIVLLIFLIVFIVIFSKVHTALPDAGGDVFSHIGASPFQGTYEGDIEGWEGADVSLSWGVDIGYILAMVAAILFIVGGTVEYTYGMRAKRELEDAMAHIGRMPFRERKAEEPEKRGRFRRK